MKKASYIGSTLALVASFLLPTVSHAVTTCPTGSVVSGSNSALCTPNPATVSALTQSQTKNCPTGFILNFQQTLCTAISTQYSATVTNGYTCLSSADLLATDTHICTTPSGTTTYSATATNNYSCPSGGSLSGSTCYFTTSYNPIQTLTCPSGYSLSGSTCSQTSTYSAHVDSAHGGIDHPYCNSGDSLSGYSCTHSNSTYTSVAYSCNSGDSLNSLSTLCLHSSTGGASLSTTYSCASGDSLSGTTCSHAISGTTYNSTLTTTYTCNVGDTLSGQDCLYSTTTQSVTILYSGSCPSHYSMNSADGLCYGLAFSPSSNIIQTTYLCITQNTDGSQIQSVYTYDATYYSPQGAYRTCQATTIAPTANTGSYICETNSPQNNGYISSLDFASQSDVTGSASDGSVTTCFYTGDSVVITDTTLPDYSFLLDNSTSCDLGVLTYDQYLSCLANV